MKTRKYKVNDQVIIARPQYDEKFLGARGTVIDANDTDAFVAIPGTPNMSWCFYHEELEPLYPDISELESQRDEMAEIMEGTPVPWDKPKDNDEGDADDARAEIEARDRKIAVMQLQITERDCQIDNLENENIELRQQIDALRSSVEKHTGDLKMIREQRDQARGASEAYRDAAQISGEEILELEKQGVLLQTSLENRTEDLETAIHQRDQAREACRDAESRYHNACAKVGKLEKRLRDIADLVDDYTIPF